jgi:hypothetical protein
MRSLLIFKSILVLSILPAASWSQSAMDILEKSIQMDHERKEGVSNYSVDQSTMNHRMLLYYEKIEGYAADGTPYSTFRLVPPAEIAERKDPNQKMSSDDLRLYADKVEESGAAVSDEMNKSGMPAGLLTAMGPPPGEEEWASPDPRVSSGAMADFLRAAATAQENRSDGSADAAAEAQQMRQFAPIPPDMLEPRLSTADRHFIFAPMIWTTRRPYPKTSEITRMGRSSLSTR